MWKAAGGGKKRTSRSFHETISHTKKMKIFQRDSPCRMEMRHWHWFPRHKKKKRKPACRNVNSLFFTTLSQRDANSIGIVPNYRSSRELDTIWGRRDEHVIRVVRCSTIKGNQIIRRRKQRWWRPLDAKSPNAGASDSLIITWKQGKREMSFKQGGTPSGARKEGRWTPRPSERVKSLGCCCCRSEWCTNRARPAGLWHYR